MLHISYHFIFPMLLIGVYYRKQWKRSYLIIMSTMLVDLDHLLASPIYVATRCSIGFHPLHSELPIIIYIVLTIVPKTRLIGLGLLIHMSLDSTNCQANNGVWFAQ